MNTLHKKHSVHRRIYVLTISPHKFNINYFITIACFLSPSHQSCIGFLMLLANNDCAYNTEQLLTPYGNEKTKTKK